MKVKSERQQKPWMNVHLLIFVFLASFYLITTTGHLTTSMCVSAYKTAESLIEDGDFALDRPRLETGIGKDGKYYNYEGLAFLLVVAAFFGLFKFLGHAEWLPFTNQLLTPISCLILYLISKELKYSTKTSILLALIYGAGTMAMVHSRYLMPEPLTTIVYLAAFFFLLKYKNMKKRKWLLLCGCCTGLALIVRPDAIFFIFGIILGVLFLSYKKYRTKKKVLWPIAREVFIFLAPLVLCFAIFAYYNYARFGDIFELGYATKAQVAQERPERNQEVPESEVKNQEVPESEGKNQEIPKSEGKITIHPIHGLADSLLGFAGMWIIPCRSIFFINPVLIFVFWALKDFWKKYRFEFLILGIIFVLYVLLFSNRGPRSFPGSSAWGVRYMVPVISFMVIIMGIFIEKIMENRNLLFKIFIAVFALSIVLQCIGASQSYVHTQNYLEEHYTPHNKWQAREMMNMNPRWNLITENIKRIHQGHADLLFYNFLFRRETLVDYYYHAKWIGPTLFFLVCSLIITGYLLFKTLRMPTSEPLKKKFKGKKKRHNKSH